MTATAVASVRVDARGLTDVGKRRKVNEDHFVILNLHKAAEVRQTTPEQKGDWRPMVFLFTDGEPTDSWQAPVERFKQANKATLIACGAGPEVNDATLRRAARAERDTDQ